MNEFLAAVDVGTNSLHLVVARVADGGGFEPIEREKEMVRLGRGAGDMKRLDDDAIDRAVAALGRYRQLAESRGAHLRAVATSAVREAENRKVFVKRAREEAGVEVEVISGYEEARLIHLGVLQALPVFDERRFVVDIGGGSTELIVGEQDELLFARSMKLGAIRLTERFFPEEVVKSGAVKQCRRHIRSVLSPLRREITALGHSVAVGTSGTIESVALIAHGRVSKDELRTLNGFTLSRADIEAVVEDLIAARNGEPPSRIRGLDQRRADIMLAGALILEQVVAAFDVETVVFSEYALREGVLLDTLERERGAARHHLRDVRHRSVLHLAELCDPDPEHSSQVAHLALRLFDETAKLHRLGDDERELLEAAALLANVGLFVSHDMHHKHSYYVIRNTEHLAGFTDHEIQRIALVARYHRKSHPRDSHSEFSALDEEDRYAVRVLAGLLRVAIGLDRTHEGRVRGVTVSTGTKKDPSVVIMVEPVEGADATLELFSAGERLSLLEEVLDVEVRVVDASDPAPSPAPAAT